MTNRFAQMWEQAPIMDESFFSRTNVFTNVEDICKSTLTTAPSETWLKFTTLWTWPGPECRLYGGPQTIHNRLGIRGFNMNEIRVTPEDAINTAINHMESNEKVTSPVSLYWPLTPACTEPAYYCHTTNGRVVVIGAYSNETNVM